MSLIPASDTGTSPGDPAILVSDHGRARILTLNRPSRGNALSTELVDGLLQALDRIATDTDPGGSVGAVVLTGAGRHFCTGFDLSTLDAETDATLLARFVAIERLLQRVARFPLPVVALARGFTMGAGADLFASASHRWIVDDATFSFPGASGFGIALGGRRLAVRVGSPLALQWIRDATRIAAGDALASGLATRRLTGSESVDGVLTDVLAEEAAKGTGHDGASSFDGLRGGAAATADDADLGALARSAVTPSSLKSRIAAYRERLARR